MNPSLLAVILFAGTAYAGTPIFVNATTDVGIDILQIGPGYPEEGKMMGGMAAADFNRDGWMDLYVVRGGDARDALYMNDGTGHFTDVGGAWGIGTPAYCSGVAVGDVDGDGWIDVYVSTHGTQADGLVIDRHRLYRNLNGTGFEEIALAAGVGRTSPSTPDGFSAVFGDYDLDGDLDLAVAGWRGQSRGNRLFRNDGTGQFTDVTATAILHDMTPVRGFTPRFTDMDGDRYPELLWVADFSTSRYLRNNRDGTFTEMTSAAGVGHDQNGMGSAVGDFDNDGDPDWYVSSIFLPAAFKEGNKLYVNEGGHVFSEVAEARGAHDGGWGWGVEAIDIDHDGDLDIAEANGWVPGIWGSDNLKLYINDGTAHFTEAATASGLVHTGLTRGLIRIDHDNDGDQDIVVGGYHTDVRLFRNDVAGPDTHWLRVLLDTSAHSDLAPDGFGAVVRARTGDSEQMRILDGGASYLAVSEFSAHFGLGASEVIDDLVVEWPNGRWNRWRDVPSDQSLTLSPCFIDGDADGDCSVGMQDLGMTLEGWGNPTQAWRNGDVNGDGAVDFRDLNLVLDGWGE